MASPGGLASFSGELAAPVVEGEPSAAPPDAADMLRAGATRGVDVLRPRRHSSTVGRCLTPCETLERMADTITFRLDEDAALALAALTRDGTSASTAVRAALIGSARARARAVLRAEAEALAADEQDRAEAAQVLRDMETLRAW